jgi:hypothetical protein
LLEQARELDALLRRMGRERGAQLVEPAADWYGIDPIHLRRSLRREAWDRIVSLWFQGSETPGRPFEGRLRMPLLGAAELRLVGITLRSSQPVLRLADGTTVALY